MTDLHDGFLQLLPNRFNINDPDHSPGTYVQPSGNLVASGSYQTSGFIPVTPGEVHRYSSAVIQVVRFYSYFDAAKAPINSGGQNAGTFTPPANAAFIRVSIYNGAFASSQFEENATPTPYTAYGVEMSDAAIGNTRRRILGNDSIQIAAADFITTGKNLFNANDPELVLNKWVTSGGLLSSNTAYQTSGYIPVTPGLAHRFSTSGSPTVVRFFAYFNDAKSALNVGGSNTNTFTPPTDAAFIRISMYNNTVASAQFEEADEPTSYEQFGYVLNAPLLGVDPTAQLSEFQAELDLMSALLRHKREWTTPDNILFLGDSYHNDGNDIPARILATSDYTGDYQTFSVAGAALATLPTEMVGFDQSAFDTVAICRVTNDVQGSATSLDLKTRLTAVLNSIELNKNIVILTCPPIANGVGYSDARRDKIVEFNSLAHRIANTVQNIRVYDINVTLDADRDGAMDVGFRKSDYETASNIHPNQAGSDAAAVDAIALLELVTVPENELLLAIKAQTDQLAFTGNKVNSDAPTAQQIAVATEAALLDDGDGQQLIDAIVQLINSNLDLPALELSAIAARIRSELTLELGQIVSLGDRVELVQEAIGELPLEVRGAIDLDLAAIKNKTDQLSFSIQNQVDSNSLSSVTSGPGSISTEVLVQASGSPVADVSCWISTDSAGDNVVAGTLVTDDFGSVTFLLDAGSYYLWRDIASLNFPNPVPLEVS